MTDDDEANAKARRLLPDPEVAKRYGRTLMTLNRWTRDKELGFPRPVKIRERNYRYEDELVDFDERQVLLSIEGRKRKLGQTPSRRGTVKARKRPANGDGRARKAGDKENLAKPADNSQPARLSEAGDGGRS